MSKGIPNNQIKTQNTINQAEHQDSADAKRVTLVDQNGNAVSGGTGGGSAPIQLLTLPYDAGVETYPTPTQEIVSTFLGGLAGTPVQRVTLNYSDSTKENLTDFQREFWNGSSWIVG
jgi:hypothetical protein